MIQYMNKMIEEKTHNHLSGNRKTFEKVQHPFMIKTLNKPVLKGNCFNTMKIIWQ